MSTSSGAAPHSPAGWWCQRHSWWFPPWCLSSGIPSWGPRMGSSRTAAAWHTCHKAHCSTWPWTRLQERTKRRRDFKSWWKTLNDHQWDLCNLTVLSGACCPTESSRTNFHQYANAADYYFWKDIQLKLLMHRLFSGWNSCFLYLCTYSMTWGEHAFILDWQRAFWLTCVLLNVLDK